MSERTMYVPEIILWQGDGQQRLNEASLRRDQAVTRLEMAKGDNRKPLMVGDADPLADLRRAVEKAEADFQQVVTEESQRATTVRVEQIARGEWRALVNDDAHKPRPGNALDEAEGWNTDTLPDAAVRAALVEPEFSSNAKRDEWLERKITPGEFDLIWETVKGVTLGRPKDPDEMLYGQSFASVGE